MKNTNHYKEECESLRAQLNYRFEIDPVTTPAAMKESQRRYRKVGKKFVPINDPCSYDGLENGFWLIHVKNGSTSIRQQVNPATSALNAAACLMEDKLIPIIAKACEAKPTKIALSKEEREDWEAFIAKHGDSFRTLNYPSFQANAEAIINVLTGKATNKQ